jgi:hypothetical protein
MHRYGLASARQGRIDLAPAAPLNPAYIASEVEFYLSDTKAKLLLVHRGAIKENSEAVKAARKLDIPVAEVYWEAENRVLSFSLANKTAAPSKFKDQIKDSGSPKEEDVALLLHVRCLPVILARC